MSKTTLALALGALLLTSTATLAQEAVTELTACLKELTGIFAELGAKADLDELREFLNQIEADEGAVVESV